MIASTDRCEFLSLPLSLSRSLALALSCLILVLFCIYFKGKCQSGELFTIAFVSLLSLCFCFFMMVASMMGSKGQEANNVHKYLIKID